MCFLVQSICHNILHLYYTVQCLKILCNPCNNPVSIRMGKYSYPHFIDEETKAQLRFDSVSILS